MSWTVEDLAKELWRAKRRGSKQWEDLPEDVREYWRDRARERLR